MFKKKIWHKSQERATCGQFQMHCYRSGRDGLWSWCSSAARCVWINTIWWQVVEKMAIQSWLGNGAKQKSQWMGLFLQMFSASGYGKREDGEAQGTKKQVESPNSSLPIRPLSVCINLCQITITTITPTGCCEAVHPKWRGEAKYDNRWNAPLFVNLSYLPHLVRVSDIFVFISDC